MRNCQISCLARGPKSDFTLCEMSTGLCHGSRKRLSTYFFDIMKLKILFLLNCESQSILLKLLSLEAYLEKKILTLKAPRKKMHLKMSSAEVVCCKKLPSITYELSKEANSLDAEQTAPIGAV